MRAPRVVTVVAVTASVLAALIGGRAATGATPAGGTERTPAAGAAQVSYWLSAAGLPLAGHGYGNGIGLSQWGAYGAAAVRHLTAGEILGFYYPHTTSRTLPGNPEIGVLLRSSAAASAWAGVAAAPGLQLTSAGTTTTLPATVHGQPVSAWRCRRDGTGLTLQARTGSRWRTRQQPAVGSAAEFTASAGQLTVLASGGLDRAYRGSLAVTISGGTLYAVNHVDLEDYVAAVVPEEMPASWPAAALRAQAVAARSYATYQMRHPRSPLWDVYADTRDQAYGGVAAQTPKTDRAVRSTAGTVRVDGNGSVIFAAYGAADGGYTVAGTVAGAPVPYLPAQPDPYDDLIANSASAWTATLTRQAVAAAYPGIGSPRRIVVAGRDGHGEWGGRITEVTVRGSDGSVTVSGTGFAAAVGLRSPWWSPQLPPGPVRGLTAAARAGGGGVTARWQPPTSRPGRVRPTGYLVTVDPGGEQQKTSELRLHIGGLPPATAYAVTVRPTSAVGRGRALTVSSAVRRIAGRLPAVTRSRELWPAGGARAAVLVDSAAPRDGLAAATLAGAVGGPVLPARHGGLGRATRAELARALPPHHRVWLVGPTFTSRVVARLKAGGWRPRRVSGPGPAATAAAVADRLAGTERVRQVVEADLGQPGQTAVAAAVARATGGVLLLTRGHRLPAATARWLATHRRLAAGRWALGHGAVRADPKATVTLPRRGAAALAVAVAQRWFTTATTAAIAGAGDPVDLQAAAAAGGPLLVAPAPGSLSPGTLSWLGAARSRLTRVDLVGPGSWLPYRPLVAQVNAAVLPG